MNSVKIYVSLKKTVADPQGLTVKHALESLGYKGIREVCMRKYIEIKMKNATESQVNEMCKKLLVNPIIEEYRMEITLLSTPMSLNILSVETYRQQ